MGSTSSAGSCIGGPSQTTAASTGRATLRQATRASDEAERRLLAALDDDEATQLRELLTRLATGA